MKRAPLASRHTASGKERKGGQRSKWTEDSGVAITSVWAHQLVQLSSVISVGIADAKKVQKDLQELIRDEEDLDIDWFSAISYVVLSGDIGAAVAFRQAICRSQ
jgi:hypothetical protein